LWTHPNPRANDFIWNLILHYNRKLLCKEVGPGRVKIGPLKWVKLKWFDKLFSAWKTGHIWCLSRWWTFRFGKYYHICAMKCSNFTECTAMPQVHYNINFEIVSQRFNYDNISLEQACANFENRDLLIFIAEIW
jgi:hypothetical protein